MKKLSLIAVLAAIAFLMPSSVHAQAWHKGAKVFAIGIGGSNFIRFGNDFYGNRATYGRTTGQISFQGEFGIHDYVGIGFTTGIGFAGGRYLGWSSEINFPIGAIGNFHFYKLIDDKTSSNIHSDKLDIYAGLNIGSGVAIMSYGNGSGSDAYAIFFAGPQVGIRYYFTDMFGVNFETGYGKNWVNAGIVLKID